MPAAVSVIIRSRAASLPLWERWVENVTCCCKENMPKRHERWWPAVSVVVPYQVEHLALEYPMMRTGEPGVRILVKQL